MYRCLLYTTAAAAAAATTTTTTTTTTCDSRSQVRIPAMTLPGYF